MTPPEPGRFSSSTRLAVYKLCFAVCGLAYLRIIPAPFGIIFAAVVPLLWAVEAYRRQSRVAFMFAALVVFLALVPLLKLMR